jgi:cytochrome c-type biogenesis protein CcmH/NrfF
MPKSPRLRSKLFLVFLLTVALLQSAVPLADARVRKLGELLKCQCGCGASITECNMINCHFADPVREELLKLVESGMSEQAILDAFVEKHGKIILRKPPTEGFYLVGWIMPFVGVAGGLALVWIILQQYLSRRPAAVVSAGGAPPADSPELARYRDRIEKDLADLE